MKIYLRLKDAGPRAKISILDKNGEKLVPSKYVTTRCVSSSDQPDCILLETIDTKEWRAQKELHIENVEWELDFSKEPNSLSTLGRKTILEKGNKGHVPKGEYFWVVSKRIFIK